jgi:hypothetical protein
VCNPAADPPDPNCALYPEYNNSHCIVPGREAMARLQNVPVYRTWPEELLHIGDCEVVPVATYAIRTWLSPITYTDPPLLVNTIRNPGDRHYGDTVGTGTGDLPPLPGFTPPNGVVNVSDAQAFILTVQGPLTPSTHPVWVDLHGSGVGYPPDFLLNVSDLQRVLFGLAGQTYTDSPGQLTPGDCP